MAHTCHAHECTASVPPRMFMCGRHWFSLRKSMQDAIWREYRPRQEVDKKPSLRYLAVSMRAIGEVAFKPNNEHAAWITAGYVQRSEEYRKQAIAGGFGDPLGFTDPAE